MNVNECCKAIEIERKKYHRKFCQERQANLDGRPSREMVRNYEKLKQKLQVAEKKVTELSWDGALNRAEEELQAEREKVALLARCLNACELEIKRSNADYSQIITNIKLIASEGWEKLKELEGGRMSDKSSESIQEITKVLFERHMAIREKMCIEELTRIIDEQIKSGDFMQYVCHSDNSFAFTYLPYRGVVRLKQELPAERENVALLREAVEYAVSQKEQDYGMESVYDIHQFRQRKVFSILEKALEKLKEREGEE